MNLVSYIMHKVQEYVIAIQYTGLYIVNIISF